MSLNEPKILVVDDDETWLDQAPLILENMGDLKTCISIDHALEAIDQESFDVILLDINFEGDQRSGLDVFRRVSASDSEIDTIVISGETDPQRLISIMNSGITRFLSKPCSPDDIRATVRQILRAREMRKRAANKVFAQNEKFDEDLNLIGRSKAMADLRNQIISAAKSGTKDILLLGETGVGKEVVARTLAFLGDRANRFIPIHCAAISEGLAESELFGHVKGAFTGAERNKQSAFEAAGGGYIFFDEIGDMPLQQQAKLLRVLQERKVQPVGSFKEIPVSFRSISATNIDILEAIAQKRFREDLYYRIAKMVIQIPPLRKRVEDVPDLFQYFLAQYQPGCDVTPDALELLREYHWPGNVRQLEATVHQSVVISTSKIIREKEILKVLPDLSRKPASMAGAFLGAKGAAFVKKEKEKYKDAIVRAGGNRTKAAEYLNISRATFFRRAKELGLTRNNSLLQ